MLYFGALNCARVCISEKILCLCVRVFSSFVALLFEVDILSCPERSRFTASVDL